MPSKLFLMSYIGFVLILFFSLSINYVYAQPYWLEEGSYAEYEFGAGALFGNVKVHYLEGSMRWECISIDENMATIEETIIFSIPEFYTNHDYTHRNNFSYIGKEYYDMAKKDDFTFITEFPIENVNLDDIYLPDPYPMRDENGEIVIDKETGQPIMIIDYVVSFYSLSETTLTATFKVDLSTRDVYDLDSDIIGRWLWWIYPDVYSLADKTPEIAFYNWRGYEVPVSVRYWNKDMEDVKNRLWDMAFKYVVPEGCEEWFLMSGAVVEGYEPDENVHMGYQNPVDVSNIYDAESGYLLYSNSYMLSDDISIHYFGMEAHIRTNTDEEGNYYEMCELIDTNISFEKQEAEIEQHSDLLYYLGFMAIIIILLAVIYGGKKSGIFD